MTCPAGDRAQALASGDRILWPPTREELLDAAGIQYFEWVGPQAGHAKLTNGQLITFVEADALLAQTRENLFLQAEYFV